MHRDTRSHAGCDAAAVALIVAILLVAPAALAQVAPARLRSGPTPPLPSPRVVDAVQVWLQVSVDAHGAVTAVTPLEPAPLFGDLLRDTLMQWTFDPATVDGDTAPSEVLVAGLFRSASLYSLGPQIRPPATRLASRASPIPVPQSTEAPSFPPNTIGSGVVVLEVDVRPDGAVDRVTAVRSQAGFDRSAIDAARRWRFQPARRDGRPVPSVAYLVFGFREPVVPPPVPR